MKETQIVIQLIAFIWQHRIFYLVMLTLMGLVAHVAGEILHKKTLDKIIQGQNVSEIYKPLALSLSIGGMVLMIIAAIALYFVGGYDPFLERMGWL